MTGDVACCWERARWLLHSCLFPVSSWRSGMPDVPCIPQCLSLTLRGPGTQSPASLLPSPLTSPSALSLAALCLVLGCMIFPDGWDAETIRDMCGEKTGKYSLGDCSVRWAYILAIIGILNALILSFLAFVLGNRQNDLLHEELKTESKGGRCATRWEHHGVMAGTPSPVGGPSVAVGGSRWASGAVETRGKPKQWPGWGRRVRAAEPLPSGTAPLTLSLCVLTDFVGTAVSPEFRHPVPYSCVACLGATVLGGPVWTGNKWGQQV